MGKDTVGKILQFLSLPPEFAKKNGDVLADMEYEWYCANKSSYQIKKYAGKLKDIACLLIGCTREQLEDREFKETELGEEWWLLESQDEDKAYISYLDNIELSNHPIWKIIKITPRKLLQLLGTEAGREIIHPNIWVNALFADYKVIKRDFKDGNYIGGSCVDCGKLIGVSCAKRQPWCLTCSKKEDKPNWIITDVRFPNEAKAIKDRGGIVIRVNRYDENGMPYKTLNNHPSETALDDYEFDITIDNNGTIEDLIEKFKSLKLI